jgi:hypothetical protein
MPTLKAAESVSITGADDCALDDGMTTQASDDPAPIHIVHSTVRILGYLGVDHAQVRGERLDDGLPARSAK